MDLRNAPIGLGLPCVAVVMAAYNAEQTIGRAVQSALGQAEVAEIVVVDDGSTDATGEVASACDDGTGRLRVVRQENAGPSAARNRGLALTRAPIWCVLDADDAFAPRRIEILLAAVGDAWDLAADPVLFRLGSRGEHRLEPAGPAPQTVTLESFVRGNVPQRKSPRCELGYLKPLIRRDFVDRHGLAFDPTLRFAEDYVLYASALTHGARFVWARGAGYVAHVRGGSLSHSQTVDDYEQLIAFDRSLLVGRSRPEAAALRKHVHLMQLKAQYLRVEEALADGRRLRALLLALRDPVTAGFMFNHRYRPGLSRTVKQLVGLDPRREFSGQLRPRLAASPGERASRSGE